MSNENLICPICGEPTSVWYGNARKDRLCRKHADMFKAGELYVDSHNRFREKNTGNILTSTTETKNKETSTKTETTKKEATHDQDPAELTCIICGEPSNGKHFCLKCYHKYKEKVILLKIRKCEFPTGDPIDESYEGVYECQDGHIVKSIAEQTIDDELCNKGIFHAYEPLLDIGEEKPLKPDFCLKNYLGEGKDVYIEYFGLKGQPKYDEHTEYKMKHYRRLGITLICLYPKDSKNLKFALQSKVFNKEKIKIGEINHEEK